MSPYERARLVALLPSDPVLDANPPEGDPHSKATASVRFTLDSFFRQIGRKLYVSSNLAVYYPEERCFAPDVIVVRDVEPHDRDKWVVAREGKGLDLALEVHVWGNRVKDEVENVARYARLGIEEYFFFDRGERILRGYRMPAAGERRGKKGRVYQPIVPKEGRLSSTVLGLDLMLEGQRLRFFHGGAAVLEANELIARLGAALNEALASKEEAERRAVRLEEAERRAARLEEAERRAAASEKELAAAREEIERLRRTQKPDQ